MTEKWKKKRLKAAYFRFMSQQCMADWSFTKEYFLAYDFTFFRDGIIGKKRLMRVLSKWEAADTAALERKIQWLIETGTRVQYAEESAHFASLRAEERQSWKASLNENDPDYIENLVLIESQDYLRNGIAGYDYAWAIFLARVGRRVGLLSRQKAAEYMDQAALAAQHTFSCWDDYMLSFYAGDQFHAALQRTGKRKNHAAYACAHFQFKNSLLNQVSWKNDLVGTSV